MGSNQSNNSSEDVKPRVPTTLVMSEDGQVAVKVENGCLFHYRSHVPGSCFALQQKRSISTVYVRFCSLL